PAAMRRSSVAQSVRAAREQTAVETIGVGRALEPHVLNPIAFMLGSRVLPSVLREIVSHHVCRMSLLENLGRTCRLDRTTRQHGNGRRSVGDTLGEKFRVLPLVVAFQQRAEVLDAFAVQRVGGLEAGPAQLTSGR